MNNKHCSRQLLRSVSIELTTNAFEAVKSTCININKREKQKTGRENVYVCVCVCVCVCVRDSPWPLGSVLPLRTAFSESLTGNGSPSTLSDLESHTHTHSHKHL